MHDKSLRLSRYIPVLAGVLIAALIIQRIYVIQNFSSLYADHDQTLLWTAATEYKNLRFHEPFFWGQNYNVMVEALLAVPLIAAGIPHNYALPAATSLIALSPFVLMAIIALRKRWYLTAVVSPLIILSMPLRFHLITSLPRGFVTGPALAAIAAVIVLSSDSTWRYFWYALLGMLSIAALPTAILVIIPVTAYLLITGRNTSRLYRLGLIGAGIGASIYGLMLLFYRVNKAYNCYGDRNSGTLAYSISLLADNVGSFSRYFDDVLPVYVSVYHLSAILLMLAVYLSYKGLFKTLAVIAGTSSLFLLSLGSARVLDGTDSIFLPYSRFYIATVYVSIFLVWLVDEHITELMTNKKLVAIIGTVCLLLYTGAALFTFSSGFSSRIDDELAVDQKAVTWHDTGYIHRECDTIHLIADRFGAELIVGNDYVLNYAYPALYPHPPTLILLHNGRRQERRTWLLEAESGKIRHRILIYDRTNNPYFAALYHLRSRVLYEEHHKNASIFILENSHLLTSDRFLGELELSLDL